MADVTPDKIYLVGFMAAGKSTVGQALARRLGWQAEDVDELIERRERMTIADIFARHGEPYFRRAEREMLRLLQPMRHVVVATGGGTFVDPDNRSFINLDGVSVWLDLPLPEVIARIPLDGRRPLAADRAALEQLYLARAEAYRHAHLRIDVSRLSVGDVVERIVDALAALPPPLVERPQS
ncbi:MAG: shikimate kinase [Acidobacteriota bacterium]|nr:MAG: shikimate kinase [Acidobacteriota bacterium]